MFKGFYTLTSGMMTQQTNLNVISNNMANASTPGYKKEVLTSTTFAEALISRTGNVDKSGTVPLNVSSKIRVPDETVTYYDRGALDTTGRALDFALLGDGFFEIQTPENQMVYTRNGSFTLDDQGYLYLQHVGRVMGTDGPVRLGTDSFKVSGDGLLQSEDGRTLGQIRVVDFDDYGQLGKTGEGMFLNENPQNLQEIRGNIGWKMLERSNVEAIDEVVAMITSQRALQSASQVVKMYDQLMNKAANEVGKV